MTFATNPDITYNDDDTIKTIETAPEQEDDDETVNIPMNDETEDEDTDEVIEVPKTKAIQDDPLFKKLADPKQTNDVSNNEARDFYKKVEEEAETDEDLLKKSKRANKEELIRIYKKIGGKIEDKTLKMLTNDVIKNEVNNTYNKKKQAERDTQEKMKNEEKDNIQNERLTKQQNLINSLNKATPDQKAQIHKDLVESMAVNSKKSEMYEIFKALGGNMKDSVYSSMSAGQLKGKVYSLFTEKYPNVKLRKENSGQNNEKYKETKKSKK